MARISGLGLSPGDLCYDPQHPWLLPNAFATEYECQCLYDNGDRSPCSPWWGGTVIDYTRPTTGVAENIAAAGGNAAAATVNEAGSLVGDLAGGAAGGLSNTLDVKGYMLLGGLALAAVFLLPEMMSRK